MSFSYDLKLDDTTVAAGATMTIQATRLGTTEAVKFDGSAETDGLFKIYSGSGNDTLTGGAKSDLIVGGAGNDRITGGGGGDQLYGGAGNDTFVYLAASDSTQPAADHLYDFTTGDKIDLSALGVSHFLGTAGYTGHAGEARITLQGNDWLVHADVDGDGADDFLLVAHSGAAYAWSANDFVLAAAPAAGRVDFTAEDNGSDHHLAAAQPAIVHPVDQHVL